VHYRVAIEAQKRDGGGENAGALVLGFVQELTGCRRDDGMRARFAEMRSRHHGFFVCRENGLLDVADEGVVTLTTWFFASSSTPVYP